MREYGDKVAFIGMAGRDSVGAMQKFVDRYKLDSMPHAVSIDGALWGQLRVFGQPSWLFIAADGTTTTQYRPSDAQVESEIKKLTG